MAWRNEALDQQIAMGGMTREGFFKLQEKTEEEYDAELDKQVRDGIKAQFMLDKLANAEEISVNQGELTNHLIQRASRPACARTSSPSRSPPPGRSRPWSARCAGARR